MTSRFHLQADKAADISLLISKQESQSACDSRKHEELAEGKEGGGRQERSKARSRKEGEEGCEWQNRQLKIRFLRNDPNRADNSPAVFWQRVFVDQSASPYPDDHEGPLWDAEEGCVQRTEAKTFDDKS